MSKLSGRKPSKTIPQSSEPTMNTPPMRPGRVATRESPESTAASVRLMIWVLLFPYLPLRERASVEGWTLTPIAELDDGEELVNGAAPAVRGLLRLYEIDTERPRLGALVRSTSGRVGDEFEAAAIRPLRSAPRGRGPCACGRRRRAPR